jgi:hypothetical protein
MNCCDFHQFLLISVDFVRKDTISIKIVNTNETLVVMKPFRFSLWDFPNTRKKKIPSQKITLASRLPGDGPVRWGVWDKTRKRNILLENTEKRYFFQFETENPRGPNSPTTFFLSFSLHKKNE